MTKLYSWIFLALFSLNLTAQNQVPQILNAKDSLLIPTQTFQLWFEISDAESDPVDVSIQYSNDDGKTFSPINSGLSGDIGFPIASDGSQRMVSWNYTGVISDIEAEFVRMRIIADDRQSIDIQELVNQVDTNRLKSDLAYIAAGRRHRSTGTTLLRMTKDTLESLFENSGLEHERQNFDFSGYNAENIIGKSFGINDPSKVYVVDAHFDSVINSAGADDNASGTVGVMEACRILSAYGFEHSVKFIGFDLEEAGLVGSMDYLSSGGVAPSEQIGGVINFEMIGYFDNNINTQTLPTGFDLLYPDVYSKIQADTFKGNFITNVGNMNSSDFMQAFEDAGKMYVPDLLTYSVIADAAGFTPPDFLRSDHASFWLNGHKALMITDGANFRNPNYHTPDDIIPTINYSFMSNVIKTAIATIAEQAKIRHSSQVILPPNQLSTSVQLPECNFRISPNPADQHLQFSLGDCPYSFDFIEVYNLNGVRQRQVKIRGNDLLQLNTKHWSRGVYIFKFIGKQGYTFRKIIIEH